MTLKRLYRHCDKLLTRGTGIMKLAYAQDPAYNPFERNVLQKLRRLKTVRDLRHQHFRIVMQAALTFPFHLCVVRLPYIKTNSNNLALHMSQGCVEIQQLAMITASIFLADKLTWTEIRSFLTASVFCVAKHLFEHVQSLGCFDSCRKSNPELSSKLYFCTYLGMYGFGMDSL